MHIVAGGGHGGVSAFLQTTSSMLSGKWHVASSEFQKRVLCWEWEWEWPCLRKTNHKPVYNPYYHLTKEFSHTWFVIKIAFIFQAYSVYDEEIGYCQGHSFLAAVLLLHVSILEDWYSD